MLLIQLAHRFSQKFTQNPFYTIFAKYERFMNIRIFYFRVTHFFGKELKKADSFVIIILEKVIRGLQ